MGPGYLSKAQLAALLGVSEVHLDRERRRLGEVPVRRVEHTVYLDGASLVRLWIEDRVRKAMEKAGENVDPLLSGPATDSLEECRKQKARVLKVEADQAEGQSVRLSELEPGLRAIAEAVRRSLEILQRRWGAEAAQLVSDSILEAEQSLDRLFAKPIPEPEPPVRPVDAPASSADDGAVG